MNRNEKKLKQFYKELASWLNAGMPEHKVFHKGAALCHQLSRWCGEFPWYSRIYYNTNYIRHLQTERLWKGYGSSLFPFGELKYAMEVGAGNHYINKNRLAFIFEQAGVKQENK